MYGGFSKFSKHAELVVVVHTYIHSPGPIMQPENIRWIKMLELFFPHYNMWLMVAILTFNSCYTTVLSTRNIWLHCSFRSPAYYRSIVQHCNVEIRVPAMLGVTLYYFLLCLRIPVAISTKFWHNVASRPCMQKKDWSCLIIPTANSRLQISTPGESNW